jgi:hypothetical protein
MLTEYDRELVKMVKDSSLTTPHLAFTIGR